MPLATVENAISVIHKDYKDRVNTADALTEGPIDHQNSGKPGSELVSPMKVATPSIMSDNLSIRSNNYMHAIGNTFIYKFIVMLRGLQTSDREHQAPPDQYLPAVDFRRRLTHHWESGRRGQTERFGHTFPSHDEEHGRKWNANLTTRDPRGLC